VLLYFLCANGCSEKQPNPPTIVINTASPSSEIPLLAGEDIQLKIAVITHNASTTASFGIVVQAADGTLIGTAGPTKLQTTSESSLILSARIPETSSVSVFAALYDNSNENSIAVDMQLYRVVGRKAK
jgi:hypothetical protein